jgi:hypothetical protein
MCTLYKHPRDEPRALKSCSHRQFMAPAKRINNSLVKLTAPSLTKLLELVSSSLVVSVKYVRRMEEIGGSKRTCPGSVPMHANVQMMQVILRLHVKYGTKYCTNETAYGK